MFAVVEGQSELGGGTRGKDVDGVGNGRAREELFLQFVGHGTLNLRDVESALREGVGEHDARAAGMCDDGEITAFERWQGEDTAHGGEFLTAEAAYDARLAEQCLDGSVAGGDGSRMAGCRTAAALRRTCLDGSYAAALADE